MTSKEERLKFAGQFSDDEWKILASNPRFLNALDESTSEAMDEATEILHPSRPGLRKPGRLFPEIRVRRIDNARN